MTRVRRKIHLFAGSVVTDLQMSPTPSAFLVTAWFAVLAAASCGTDAKGVNDCRSIEKARCRAAANCGVISDVDACQRFYRDQCLHGLPIDPPGKVAVSECVAAIESAGECAKTGADDAGACSRSLTPESACDKIQHPERFAECSFLSSEPVEETGGSGNSGSGGQPEETTGGMSATGGSSEQSASGGSAGSG